MYTKKYSHLVHGNQTHNVLQSSSRDLSLSSFLDYSRYICQRWFISGFLQELPELLPGFSDVPAEISESCYWDFFHCTLQDFCSSQIILLPFTVCTSRLTCMKHTKSLLEGTVCVFICKLKDKFIKKYHLYWCDSNPRLGITSPAL